MKLLSIFLVIAVASAAPEGQRPGEQHFLDDYMTRAYLNYVRHRQEELNRGGPVAPVQQVQVHQPLNHHVVVQPHQSQGFVPQHLPQQQQQLHHVSSAQAFFPQQQVVPQQPQQPQPLSAWEQQQVNRHNAALAAAALAGVPRSGATGPRTSFGASYTG